MLQQLSPEKAHRVIDNILMACKDITRLSPEAFRWLYLKAGFISHFDLEGFIENFQNSRNLHDNILAYQTQNTRCTRSIKDKDYPYYLQQSEMYRQIVENLLANPSMYSQNKRTDEFCIELSKENQDEIHKITLVTHQGTSSVLCDKEFLINLQNNITHHLKESEHECLR